MTLGQDDIAASFGVSPELLPYLPELLADIWVLGSWPDRIVDLLRPLDLEPETTRVLEVGCGKGAVSVPIAQRLDFSVHGVDLFAPFLDVAKAKAREAGVAGRCRFEAADIREAAGGPAEYDVAILAAVGAVMGSYEATVGWLRRAVRPGGYMVIDDGYLLDPSPENRPPGYEYCRDREETIRELTAHGDVIEKEVIVPTAELRAYNQSNTECIRARADRLARQRPELASALEAYVQSEIDECRYLEEKTVAAIWLLRREA